MARWRDDTDTRRREINGDYLQTRAADATPVAVRAQRDALRRSAAAKESSLSALQADAYRGKMDIWPLNKTRC